MKHKLAFIASILLLVFGFALDGFGQWVQTNGPYGGSVWCLAMHKSDIFAGTDGGGIFRSTDSGATWNQTLLLPGINNQVQTIIFKDSILIAGLLMGYLPFDRLRK